MTDGEKIGRNIVQWFHSNPLRAKMVAWLIVAAIIAGCVFVAIDIVRSGKWFKAFVIFGVSGFFAWRALKSRSASHADSAKLESR
jgi:hypothetical protein